jgi:hypothetical protein
VGTIPQDASFLKQSGMENAEAHRDQSQKAFQKTTQTLKLINLFHVYIILRAVLPLHGLFARDRRLGILPESFFAACSWWLSHNHKSLRTQDELIGRHPFKKKEEPFQESIPAYDPLLPVPRAALWVWKVPQKRAPVMEVFAEPLEHIAVVSNRRECQNCNGRFINLVLSLRIVR